MAGLTDHVCMFGKLEMEARDIISKQAALPADKRRYSAALIDDVEKHLKTVVKFSMLLMWVSE